MLRLHHAVLSLPLIVLATAPSLRADSPAIAALKEKGLTRSGRVFVIEAEKTVLEKSSKIRSALAELTAAAERKYEAELAAREYAQLEERRGGVAAEALDQLNQQINVQGFQQNINRTGGFGRGGIRLAVDLAAAAYMLQMNLADRLSRPSKPVKKPRRNPTRKLWTRRARKSLEAAKGVPDGNSGNPSMRSRSVTMSLTQGARP